MTVQTRFKDEPAGQKNHSEGKKENENSGNGEKTFIKAEKSGFVVGTIPVFTGDDEDDGGDGRETEKTTGSKKKGFFGSGGLFGKKKGERCARCALPLAPDSCLSAMPRFFTLPGFRLL